MKLGGSRRSNSDHEAELRWFYNPQHRSSQGNKNQLWKLGLTRFHNWLKVARDCVEDYKPNDAEGLAFEVEAPIEINKVSNLDVSQFSLPSYLEIRCKEDKLGISLEEETQYGEMKFDCDKEPKFDQMVSAFDWIVPPIFYEYVDNEEVNLKNVNRDTFQDKTIEFVSLKNSTSLCQEGICKSDSTRDILASTCALDVKSCVDQTSSNILMVSGNRDMVLGFKNGCTPQHIATHEQPKVVEVTPTIEFHDPVWRQSLKKTI
ncbi:hypothetical protein DVH24_018702 [Malus domestica]|uniref:Uncharacterized protein n=1 Tax=Malus domestica TaxID=3750 RepID=A0A498HPL0_MALDO|nr:hypothetical protein DVH24_018702 [Malus domestica]